MCGIAGIYRLKADPSDPITIIRMCNAIIHRGPDDGGAAILADGRLALGHRRLSIIDLSDKAHQPMRVGSVWVSYNGEVYNFKELRKELEARHQFQSASDTEVVGAAYDQWGAGCFTRFNGMFALAIWDERRRRLILARDRYGVKPLYYWTDGTRLVFASEVKAILAAVGKAGVDLIALDEYLTFQNVLSNRTLFENIRIAPPGCYIEVDEGLGLQTHRYWDFCFRPEIMDEEEAVGETLRLLKQAVKRQLVADVPVASYLSSGLDTGSIVALARPELPELDTFTCGFDLESVSGLELAFDEREQARELADKVGCRYHETVLKSGDMEAVMPELVRCLEDLRVGQSYPNYYIAKLAGGHGKVALSGTGGDEIFGGYPWRYQEAEDPVRYRQYWQRVIPNGHRSTAYQERVLCRIDRGRGRAIMESLIGNHLYDSRNYSAAMTFEARTFLHGLLVVEDKVSMAHSLEVRVPFLDNDLVDFAQTIPYKHKVRNKTGKVVLRKALEGLLPERVLNRRKQGFSAPDGTWFRGQSIEYVRTLLLDPKARIYEYLMPKYVGGRLKGHFEGKSNERLFIWSMLCFELWLREFVR